MPALATIAGADCLRAIVDLPARGPFTAEVRIATTTAPTGRHTLAFAGGLSLPCTVRRAGDDGRGAVTAFLVGGADGLRASVSQHYVNVFARDILGTIARASGETLATDITSAIGAVQFDRYTLAGDCSSALDTLARALSRKLGSDVTWRIRTDGALWVGVETWTAYTLPKGDALDTSEPALGYYVFAVETPTLKPGVSVAGAGNVASVRHSVTEEGVRSWVTVATPSLGSEFLRSVRSALGLRSTDARQLWRFGTFRGRVVTQEADLSTVDVTFDGAIMPPAQRVPVRYHAGIKVQFGTGDAVEIGWEAGDPDRIFARPVSDGITPVKVAIDGTSVIVNGGSLKVARDTDPIEAGTLTMTAVTAGAPPVTTLTFTWTPSAGPPSVVGAIAFTAGLMTANTPGSAAITGKITNGVANFKA